VAQLEYLEEIATHSQLPFFAVSANISRLQVAAVWQFYKGNAPLAFELLDEAVVLEQSIDPPAYGPPMDPIKCSYELYAELLMENGQFAAALQQFAHANAAYPNRALVLLGTARSLAALSDVSAATQAYSRLLSQLVDSDYDNPYAVEAARYLSQHGGVVFVH